MVTPDRPAWLSFMGLTLARPTWSTVVFSIIAVGVMAVLLVFFQWPSTWPLGARLLVSIVVGTGVLVHRCGASLRGDTAFRALLLTGLLTSPWWWVLALTG